VRYDDVLLETDQELTFSCYMRQPGASYDWHAWMLAHDNVYVQPTACSSSLSPAPTFLEETVLLVQSVLYLMTSIVTYCVIFCNQNQTILTNIDINFIPINIHSFNSRFIVRVFFIYGYYLHIVIRLEAGLQPNIGFTFEWAPYALFYRFPSAKLHEI